MNTREQLLVFVNPTIQELVSILVDREAYEQEEQDLTERLTAFVDNELCSCVTCEEDPVKVPYKPMPKKRSAWCTPTELGEHFGVPGAEINKYLHALHFQVSGPTNSWFATEEGALYSNGYTVKGHPNKHRLEWWKERIIPIISSKFCKTDNP